MYAFFVLLSMVMECAGFLAINVSDQLENSSSMLRAASDDDIYKCTAYTGAHIDVSHWITQNFSDYKDCQKSGLYTLNRRDRYFKVDIDVQRLWIIEVMYRFKILVPSMIFDFLFSFRL